MKQLKHYTINGILFVLISGSLAHFFYEWSGHNPIVGLFTPVNESIWEHMKLLFFPMLAYSFFMVFKLKADYPCIRSALCFGILAGTLCIPILFYTYTALLGKDIFILDIVIFIFSIIIAFCLACQLAMSCKSAPYSFLSGLLVCFLLICFLIFTYHPPTAALFQAPTVSKSG